MSILDRLHAARPDRPSRATQSHSLAAANGAMICFVHITFSFTLLANLCLITYLVDHFLSAKVDNGNGILS
jgi:hypothetical protein